MTRESVNLSRAGYEAEVSRFSGNDGEWGNGQLAMADHQLEQLADLIADKLAERMTARTIEPTALVDAATLADRLGVNRSYVYTNADRLGAIRLGGSRGRLRFDLEVARRALRGGEIPTAEPAKPHRDQRTAAQRRPAGSILAVRGRNAR
jgi:hypothetical protein